MIFIKNKAQNQELLLVRTVIHVIRFIGFKSYRSNICFINASAEFFYRSRPFLKFFPIPYATISKFLIKKNYYVSVNNSWNQSVGHLYTEIDLLRRIQHSHPKYQNSKIIFTSSNKTLLKQTKIIFEDKNFIILIGGLWRLVLTLTAMRYPILSIDGSIGDDDYVRSSSKLTAFDTYVSKQSKRAKLIYKTIDYYPIKKKDEFITKNSKQLRLELGITRPYVIIQIKDTKQNASFVATNPATLISAIRRVNTEGYDVVFAGREKCPNVFCKLGVINYSESKLANALNDYSLVLDASLVIASASGFCNVAETLDKPILIINSWHGIQQFGRKTLILPMILSSNSVQLTFREQLGLLVGHKAFKKEADHNTISVYHEATEDEILKAVNQLLNVHIDKPGGYLASKLELIKRDPLLKYSRLSVVPDFYLLTHKHYFCASSKQ